MSFSPIQRSMIIALICVSSLSAFDQQAVTDSALKIAGLYLKLGQDTECRAALDKVLKDSPGNADAQLLLAKLEIKLGHHTAAVKAASASLAASPDSLEATVVKARALALLGQKEEGKKLLSRVPPAELEKYADDLDEAGLGSAPGAGQPATPSESDAVDNALEAARSALAKHDLPKADALTKAALKLAPSSHDAGALRAEYLSEAGQPTEAVAVLKKMKAAHHSAAGPFEEELSLAYALQDAGNLDEAKTAFESVVSNRAYPDADRAQAREALATLNSAKSIADGEAALDAGHAEEARRLAEQVLAAEPTHADAQVLRARALAASGGAHEAAQLLAELKSKTPEGTKFEAQLDYAQSLTFDHRYREAVSAYDEVIRKPLLYTKSERDNAGEQLDDIRETHLAGLDAQGILGSFEEGSLGRVRSQLYGTRMGRTRWSAEIYWDSVELEAKLYPTAISRDRFWSSLTVDTIWNDQWRTFAHVGGFEEAALGGVTLDYTTPGGFVFGINADYNDPANDTLLLTAMNGRQNAISTNLTQPLGKHLVLESALIAREINVDGDDIGSARGTESQVRWHPFALNDGLYFAYTLELKNFSADEKTFDRDVLGFFDKKSSKMPTVYDAVPDRINRHALQAHGSIPLLAHVTASALAEVAWREEASLTEFGGVAEVLWRISGKASVNMRFEYYTGGAGPNAGSTVVMGSIGTKITW